MRFKKAALRLIAATTLVAAFGLQQAYAATWYKGLNCSEGSGATASFIGTAPGSQDGYATFTYTICTRNFGCGTQVDKEHLASGKQFYKDAFRPSSTVYIASVQVDFNGSFESAPDAYCP